MVTGVVDEADCYDFLVSEGFAEIVRKKAVRLTCGKSRKSNLYPFAVVVAFVRACKNNLSCFNVAVNAYYEICNIKPCKNKLFRSRLP